MTQVNEEAAAIARLLGDDRKRIIGWVYLWNTSELSILWIDRCRSAKVIEPPLSQDTLAKAKAVTPDAVTDLLETLSTAGQEGSL
ncbi:hypothetical protein D6850_19040 [Roseovarius spongiae]|uniref:Uncharacterized protein n=1 Tax=Roseovarius spongiae TaxID=2320272 RepID=A0A3A8B3J7_9RHOB|nr:hypothetical protein [Roseovarius spongiae]RKF12244.1 hypothetical protein D6850_19040 [Roseovarius spongiae]